MQGGHFGDGPPRFPYGPNSSLLYAEVPNNPNARYQMMPNSGAAQGRSLNPGGMPNLARSQTSGTSLSRQTSQGVNMSPSLAPQGMTRSVSQPTHLPPEMLGGLAKTGNWGAKPDSRVDLLGPQGSAEASGVPNAFTAMGLGLQDLGPPRTGPRFDSNDFPVLGAGPGASGNPADRPLSYAQARQPEFAMQSEDFPALPGSGGGGGQGGKLGGNALRGGPNRLGAGIPGLGSPGVNAGGSVPTSLAGLGPLDARNTSPHDSAANLMLPTALEQMSLMGTNHQLDGASSHPPTMRDPSMLLGGQADPLAHPSSQAMPGPPGVDGGSVAGSETSAAGMVDRGGSSNASPVLSSRNAPAQPVAGDEPSKAYGLMGLLDVIRMQNPDLSILALGSDLTTLGLNLNGPESLSSNFTSPFSPSALYPQAGSAGGVSDGGGHPRKAPPKHSLPNSYFVPIPQMSLSQIPRLNEETLFYGFYGMPRDELQLFCAHELYSRAWKYHTELKLWFRVTKASDNVNNPGAQYMYFDYNQWERRLFMGTLPQNFNAAFLPAERVAALVQHHMRTQVTSDQGQGQGQGQQGARPAVEGDGSEIQGGLGASDDAQAKLQAQKQTLEGESNPGWS